MSDQNRHDAISALNSEAFAPLAFDPDKFRSFLGDTTPNPQQQDELLKDLWVILVGFVDLGFGLHPIQHVSDLRGTLEVDSASMLPFHQNSEIIETDSAARTKVMAAGKEDS